jgi:hypothetical protein
VDLAGAGDTLQLAVTGDLMAGEGQASHQLTVRSLRQDLAPGYQTSDLSMTVKARRDRDGIVHLDELRLDNRGAGTALSLEGGIDVGEDRRSLSLSGELRQDLAKVWDVTSQYQGRGKAAVKFRVDSGNLSLFRGLAALHVTGANLKLPRAGVIVEGADGEVPVVADVVFGKKGMRFLHDSTVNAYSELRFADQHPLLSRRSFISIQRIESPLFNASPLAGNLRIEQNIVSVSQLEMGLRGGRVTGRCVVDYDGADSKVQLHVRASGVGASQGEPFDGNTAVEINVREHSVEGRAEILRISRRHLLDLLDLHDPHRADPGANRIRRVLALGYPDKVRLGFTHGFANVRVTFGGLAGLVRVDELRGVPMGPIVGKLLARITPPEEEEP